LLAYGVLQALFLQQDAVFWWCKCLSIQPVSKCENPGTWAATIPQLTRARNARNDSIGHPARRDKPRPSPVAAFFIVQHSLSGDGFSVHGYDERGAFMHKPLTPILNRLDYPLGKLGAERTEEVLMFPALVEEISRALHELRAAIEERQEPFGENWQLGIP
jgi:hypothetical protein